ncbi:hypothetical protein [Flavivirga spongiicola]|uniref:Uncharacterized protein n=1 Tax=Flavivirga spongiicola TaxID=421621 RepID=A0ABU7XYC4_9FLAO|nr:hypothetical protein [Flavivirga sp. MEBiC05379]MDO5980783.1 hypothetical protein [Flavivirga sp. MEBiC05379]
MDIKHLNIKKDTSTNNIFLNQLELLYLRLHVHNLNDAEISSFLDIDNKKTTKIKNNIKKKFKTKNWVEIILEAFNVGLLLKKDFVEDIIKEVALKHTENIFDTYINAKVISNSKLKQDLIEFYVSCENEMLEYRKNKQKFKLVKEEIDFMKYKYEHQCLQTRDILKHLNIKFNYLKHIDENIFKKLGVSNWFNAFRVAFQLNILDKSTYQFLKIEKELNYTLKKLNEIIMFSGLEPYEKKLMIYSELNELYIAIEYFYLFKNPTTTLSLMNSRDDLLSKKA